MNRRHFLQLAAGTAALSTLPARALSQGSAAVASGKRLPIERGSVLPTRGPVIRGTLPLNPPTHGMRYRTLFRFGMGGTQIGNIFAPVSEQQAANAVQAAWDTGVRYFDTSPFYGYGLSEHHFGHFLRQRKRDEYIISTKVGRVFRASPDKAVDGSLWTDPLPFKYIRLQRRRRAPLGGRQPATPRYLQDRYRFHPRPGA